MIFLVVLLLVYTCSAVNINSGVDYWGISNSFSKTKEEKQKTNKREKVKEQVSLSDEEVLKESIKWYENKLKKELPPVEYLYFKDPKRYAKLQRKWIEWKQEKIRELALPQIFYAKSGFTPEKAIKLLKDRDYRFLYFYREDCPYCKISTPEIKEIGREIKVHFIDVKREPYIAAKWKVDRTPTVIAVSPKEKKAYRWTGAFSRVSLLEYFYTLLGGKK